MSHEALRAFARRDPGAFARALVDEVRGLTRQNPSPKALPFFGLDHTEGCGSQLLDRLSELGIFRHYERVLDLGSDLGGPARWLARRRGCRVVAILERPEGARAAEVLVRHSHLTRQVGVLGATPTALPVPDVTFTHVWSVEQLHRAADKGAVLREAFRAVRPGGHIAVQDWVTGERSERVGEFSYQPAAVYREQLRSAGFVDARLQEASGLAEAETALSEILWERVAHNLGFGRAGDSGPVGDFEEVANARASGRLRRVQLFATRPA